MVGTSNAEDEEERKGVRRRRGGEGMRGADGYGRTRKGGLLRTTSNIPEKEGRPKRRFGSTKYDFCIL